jgi:DNA-binding FrmR family transcriptional regulator
MNGIRIKVEEERQCVDVLTQISASYEGVRKVGSLMIRTYIESGITQDVRSDTLDGMSRMYDEIMDVIYKYSK